MSDAPDIGVLNEDTDLHFDTGNQFRMLYLQNRSGQTVETGDVVVWDTKSPRSFKLSTKANDPLVIGVVAYALDAWGNATVQTIPYLEWGWIQTVQRCTKVKLESSAEIGNFLQTSSTAKLAKPSLAQEEGSFGIALSSGTEVEALLGAISSAPPAEAVPDWRVLAEVETTVDSDYIDLTGLDINSHWFYILFFTTRNATAESCPYQLFVEGDYTASNYFNQYIYASGTGIGANRENNPTVIGLSPGEIGHVTAFITRDPLGYFRYRSVISRNTGSAVALDSRSGSKLQTVGNITELRIAAGASGGISAGSRLVLCRPKL